VTHIVREVALRAVRSWDAAALNSPGLKGTQVLRPAADAAVPGRHGPVTHTKRKGESMELEQEVRGFVRENFIVGEASLAGDVSLTETGIIDSLGVLELVLFLEERYGVRVSEAETLPENLDTVDNIVRFVGVKLAGNVEKTERTEGYDQHSAAA
jgi:acyl carrier protein